MEPLFDDRGLIPGIVQDADTGRVLMLGWLSRVSLELTRDTGLVHFWSRSRERLWMKGETSGNSLRLVEDALDCDGDAMLLRVWPAGPACHTGAMSCFAPPAEDPTADQGFAWLEGLWRVIAARAVDLPDGSHTASLVIGGVDAVARKLLEEATEVLLAAKDHDSGAASGLRVAEEAADLVYHLLTLLAERGVEPATMLGVLRSRAS